MSTITDYAKDLSQIRSMMERSSRFISLSGLSGVCAGVFALIGAAAAYLHLNLGLYSNYYEGALRSSTRYDNQYLLFFFADALLVLVASLATGIYFTSRKAKRQGLKVWDKTAARLVSNLILPLGVGGIFCLALLYHGAIGLVAPATLVFYGLALLNGSKFTLHDIQYLGISEIVLGLVSAFFIGYGLLFWALGFGVLHIIYGLTMYIKYERTA